MTLRSTQEYNLWPFSKGVNFTWGNRSIWSTWNCLKSGYRASVQQNSLKISCFYSLRTGNRENNIYNWDDVTGVINRTSKSHEIYINEWRVFFTYAEVQKVNSCVSTLCSSLTCTLRNEVNDICLRKAFYSYNCIDNPWMPVGLQRCPSGRNVRVCAGTVIAEKGNFWSYSVSHLVRKCR